MDPAVLTMMIIRALNLALWLFFAAAHWNAAPMPLIARRLVITVMVLGMSVFVAGGLTNFGFSQDAARFLYTMFTAYAAIVAIGIRSVKS